MKYPPHLTKLEYWRMLKEAKRLKNMLVTSSPEVKAWVDSMNHKLSTCSHDNLYQEQWPESAKKEDK